MTVRPEAIPGAACPPIFLATVLLDATRWAHPRRATLRFAAWRDRIAAAGFDGVELWEYHAPPEEVDAIANRRNDPPLPRVFSAYCGLGPHDAAWRRQVAATVRRLGCEAVKFNVGKDPAALDAELEAVRDWGREMPGVDLLCECHAGTALEDPRVAARRLEPYPEIDVIVHPFHGEQEDLDAWLGLFGARVRHAHLHRMAEPGRPASLSDHPELVRARMGQLRRAGFRGTLSLEFTGGVNTPDERPEALLEQARRDLLLLRGAMEAWTP